MSRNSLIRAILAGAILAGLLLIPGASVDAVTTGPAVIAVHRNGAVDISGRQRLRLGGAHVPAGGQLADHGDRNHPGRHLDQPGRVSAGRGNGVLQGPHPTKRPRRRIVSADRALARASLCQDRGGHPEVLQRRQPWRRAHSRRPRHGRQGWPADQRCGHGRDRVARRPVLPEHDCAGLDEQRLPGHPGSQAARRHLARAGSCLGRQRRCRRPN